METMPVLFVSHGAPTLAIDPGKIGPELTALGKTLPTPKAIVIVSPHWFTPSTRVTTSSHPGVVHDFGGFPQVLYTLDYPADGDKVLADKIIDIMNEAGWQTTGDERRPLDHGAWVPLRYLYPDASIPVVQVSMPYTLTPESAYAFGAALSQLRHEGILIIGSGSMTHNLYEYRAQHTNGETYVKEFSSWIKHSLLEKNHDNIIHALQTAPNAQRAHPSPDHYFPLIVAAGAAGKAADVTYIDGGIMHGVLSMDSYVFE